MGLEMKLFTVENDNDYFGIIRADSKQKASELAPEGTKITDEIKVKGTPEIICTLKWVYRINWTV